MSNPSSNLSASFVSQAAATKTRIFRVSGGVDLTAVTTVNGPPPVGAALRDGLNHAARTGDRSHLEHKLATQPDAVALSCRQALELCPDPTGFEASRWPPHTLRRTYFSPASQDLRIHAQAAMDIGLTVLIQNQVDEDGDVDIEAILLTEDIEVDHDEIDTWWPRPNGWQLSQRLHPEVSEIGQLLEDPRWETHCSRAYWLWVKDEPADDNPGSDLGGATAEWVVEFFDELPIADHDYRHFAQDDDSDEEGRGFLTVRTRMLLWLSLLNIAGDLEMLTVDWTDWDSQVRDDMPAMVRDQPQAWWTPMSRSAHRLCEAARRGDLVALEPRTPAEEALISLATRRGYVDWARDSLDELRLRHVYEALPATDDDEVWEEILGQLTGDTDVEMLWTSRLAHQADPSDPVNQQLGVGDYRPQAWHRLFDRAIRELPGIGPE